MIIRAYNNSNTDILLPIKKSGISTEWSSNTLITREVYNGNNRIFPRNFNNNLYNYGNTHIVGAFHERYFDANNNTLAKLPMIGRSSRYTYFGDKSSIVGMGFHNQGLYDEDDPDPEYYNKNCAAILPQNATKTWYWSNDIFASWKKPDSLAESQKVKNVEKSPTLEPTHSSERCPGNWLCFTQNTYDAKYITLFPYSLLLFKNWNEAEINSYFSRNGLNIDSDSNKIHYNFGYIFFVTDYGFAYDWDDYINLYPLGFSWEINKYPKMVEMINNATYTEYGKISGSSNRVDKMPTKHYIISSWSYGGNDYKLVQVSDYRLQFEYTSETRGRITQPFFNLCLINNNSPDYDTGTFAYIDFTSTNVVKQIFILEHGCEYALEFL